MQISRKRAAAEALEEDSDDNDDDDNEDWWDRAPTQEISSAVFKVVFFLCVFWPFSFFFLFLSLSKNTKTL